MFDTAYLLASLVWGTLGVGFFIYGKRQGEPVPLAGGLLLIGICWVVWNWWILSLISCGLLATMWALRRAGY
jgi:hypothetical protein